ncbi:MAG: hypothetical protein U9P12_00880 [Verrucomicrobiota bacterium]|nr:hypothetical protein [Verrucomicrobiota bacterium]
MMLKHARVMIFSSLCLLISVASAIEDVNPSVTTNTLQGVWEAISERDQSVYQLEISENKGCLVFAVRYLKKSMVYHLTERHVAEDGLVELEFANAAGRRITVCGSGYAAEDEGLLEVQLDMNPGGTPNIWKLEFIRTDGDLTYVEMLSELSRKASAGRNAAKKSCPPRGAEGGSGSEEGDP